MKLDIKKLAEIVKKVVREGEVGTKTAPTTKPSTKPSPNKAPNPLMPPKEAPKTNPKGLFKEEEIIDKIVKRYESMKEQKTPSLKLLTILEQVLREVSLEALKRDFVETNKISQEVFDNIAKSTNGKSAYATWMIMRVLDKSIKGEDIYKYREYLQTFDKNKKEFESSDINYFKTEPLVRKFEEKAIEASERDIEHTGGDTENRSNLVSSQGIKELNSVGIKFLGITDGFQVFEVPTSAKGDNEAFKAYTKYLANCSGRDQGAKIQICTMADISHFNNYLKTGPYYVFFNLSDPKSPYQFHYESNQFMDKNDRGLV